MLLTTTTTNTAGALPSFTSERPSRVGSILQAGSTPRMRTPVMDTHKPSLLRTQYTTPASVASPPPPPSAVSTSPLRDNTTPCDAVSPRLLKPNSGFSCPRPDASPLPTLFAPAVKRHCSETKSPSAGEGHHHVQRLLLAALMKPSPMEAVTAVRDAIIGLDREPAPSVARTLTFAVLSLIGSVVSPAAHGGAPLGVVGTVVALRKLLSAVCAFHLPNGAPLVTDADVQRAAVEAIPSAQTAPASLRRPCVVAALLVLVAWCTSHDHRAATVRATLGVLRDHCAVAQADIGWEVTAAKAGDLLTLHDDITEGAAEILEGLVKDLDLLKSTSHCNAYSYLNTDDTPRSEARGSPMSVAWSGSPSLTHVFSP